MSETLKQYCTGCVDDFYNGNNDLGVDECWHLSTAQLVTRKKVGINDRPPWLHEPITTLSCRREVGSIFVEPDRTC